MMFTLENVDNLAMFRSGSMTYKKIHAVCERFKEFPTIRIFSKDSGEDRGVYYRDTITMYFSKPETSTSMFWVFLHEFKHHMMEQNIKLYREFFAADELLIEVLCNKSIEKLSADKQMGLLHDLRPTEVICNNFATEVIGKDYGAYWYQRRKRQIEKRKKK